MGAECFPTERNKRKGEKTMLQAIVGYTVILVMMYLILKNKALPAFCFAVLPVLGALAAGFVPAQVLEFVSDGVGTTWKTAVLFIFSVVYFGVMNDTGMFDGMVSFLVKRAGNNVSLICVATALIAMVGHLDGATASTYLISIPVMLPIYKKMHLRPQVMLCIIGLATGIMNLVPWGGPTIRAATAIDADATALWVSMIPMQAAALACTLVMAVYFAGMEKKRLAKEKITVSGAAPETTEQTVENQELKRPKLFWFNVALTALVIILLVEGSIPTYVIFMFGAMIALAVNYPDMKLQNSRMMAHAPNCIGLTVTLLCAGVFLGVFANSGMISSMAQVLIDLLPAFLRKYLHLLVGVLGAPIGMVMGPDPYYYGVMPLIIETVEPLGVTAHEVARAMLIGENVALAVSPCVATTFLAIGMAGVELKDHIRFSFKYMWFISILMLIFAWATGLV